jgi:hypothetical protein
MVFDEGSIKPAPTTSRASADERIHPPYKIATLVAAAAQEGLPAATLLDGTGLDAAALNDAEVKTSSRQFALACRNALAAGASPALPFRMGQAMRVSTRHVRLCAADFQDHARGITVRPTAAAWPHRLHAQRAGVKRPGLWRLSGWTPPAHCTDS